MKKLELDYLNELDVKLLGVAIDGSHKNYQRLCEELRKEHQHKEERVEKVLLLMGAEIEKLTYIKHLMEGGQRVNK